MKLITTPFFAPQDHVNFDEELLLDCARTQSQEPILRFWEPSSYFVVLGRSNEAQREVHVSACELAGIPILKRCSGGGTVLQGPGCLNYALIYPISKGHWSETISSTTSHIMATHAAALAQWVPLVRVRGVSDLCVGDVKFSGNAQRRLQHYLLFHGTFLYDFDLSKIEMYLQLPSREPEYRQNRPHREFVMNLDLSRDVIQEAIWRIWQES